MGLLRTAVKAGIAKKIYDEARKPQNQKKIKDFVASMTAKSGRRPGAPGGGRY